MKTAIQDSGLAFPEQPAEMPNQSTRIANMVVKGTAPWLVSQQISKRARASSFMLRASELSTR